MNLPKSNLVERSTLPKKFELYLTETLGVSGKTLRNYRADLSHFSGWAILYLQSTGTKIASSDGILPHFTPQLIALYKGYHLENNIPEATVNRRLSTLRNFARFLISEDQISQDPTLAISNLSRENSREKLIFARKQTMFIALTQEFARHLEEEKVSKITMKNYLSDIRHFLNWSLQKAS